MATVAPDYAMSVRNAAAAQVLDVAPAGFEKVFFTNGGADAVANAVRMARSHTGRRKILSAYRSYHGNTGIAIAATGDQRRLAIEYVTDHVHFFGSLHYRWPFWAQDVGQESERALVHLAAVIQAEGPETIAGLLLETVVGFGCDPSTRLLGRRPFAV
jgi:taurine--2-oxoglutarate transaminase